MGNLLKTLQECYQNALPFVGYRKPNSELLQAFIQTDAILHQVDDFTESGFVFSPFNSGTHPTVLIPNSNYLTERVDINSLVVDSPFNVDELNPDVDRHAYEMLVAKSVKAIKSDRFKKVVFSRREDLSVRSSTPLDVFKQLLKLHESVFVYVFYHPRVGCWLGATPETLLQVHGKRFKTMSLAGTQLHSNSIVWKEKESFEQQYVTDFIVDELKQHSTSLQVSEPYTIKAGRLAHIRTDIEGQFKSSLTSIIDRLHPTPAVCGLPKATAKTFILQHEGYDREYYSGFLGELNLKTSRAKNRRNTENKAYGISTTISNLYVNLRCLKYTSNLLSIYVGGGITADSIPEKEFVETVNKTSTIKQILS